MGSDFGLIGCHHRGNARIPGFEPDEEEAAPLLELDRDQPEPRLIEAGIILAVRYGDEAAVGGVGPGVIGTGEPPGAAHLAVDEPRAAMAADIGEGAHRPV